MKDEGRRAKEEDRQPSSSLVPHPSSFRVVTYNIHKCRGLDRRVRPGRIAEVLAEVNADVVALQEVWSVEGAGGDANQARHIADALGMEYRVGVNRSFKGGAYGNVVLSRLPVTEHANHDITWRGREPRGCLRVDIMLGDDSSPLHIFNVHLGTAFLERRHQGRRLLDRDILGDADLTGARIVLGDFNEWTRGLATELLTRNFNTADPRDHLPRARTYPGLIPFLHLDHIYYDSPLELVALKLQRSRLALIASDHLPLVADFKLHPASAVPQPSHPPAPRP